MSLDVFENHILANYSSDKAADKPHADKYLGLLFLTESYRIYGYLTVSLVKMVLVLSDLSNAKSHDIKRLFGGAHALYVDAICNPFYEMGSRITSRQFARKIGSLVLAST
ncbi:trafficking protein particle complex subunit 2-like protein isoform X2 [Schistocerca gregaria]|nr:trafficking protein particle complex subunit 2-like protein isoform X2 [Schistocerca gregaria]